MARGLLHRGNLFKFLLHPKINNNVHLSSKLLLLLNNFETNLTVAIRELMPKDKNHILTVSWMIQAMESLCKTHESIGTLVKELEIQESDLEEENMIRMYSDISLKILELCNAFALELDHLNHCNLLLKFALSKVELDLSYLESWKQHMVPKNSRIGNYGAVLSGLFESIRIPKKAKKKHSAKEKVLLRALYGVKVKTLYILSVLASAFSASSKNLFYIALSPKEMEGLPWAKPFMELQNMINPEIKNRVLYDRFNVIKDLEDVETDVKKLYKVVQEEGSVLDLVEPLKKSVKELSTSFDLVSKEIHCLLKIVISARNTLSERLLRKYTEEMGVTLPMMSGFTKAFKASLAKLSASPLKDLGIKLNTTETKFRLKEDISETIPCKSEDGDDVLIVRINWSESDRTSHFLTPSSWAWIKADRIARASATIADLTKPTEAELLNLRLPISKIQPRPAEQLLAVHAASVLQVI